MTTLHINNIGPIKDAFLELNKINILIGPQSSGKSTIAKITSFCQWAEKRFILDGSFDYDFKEQLIDFHKLSEVYFTKSSSFEYISEYIKITYKGLSFKLNIRSSGNSENYKKSRNIYIPSERNFVSTIPNLGRYNETNDNIMSFLYDWYEAKKKYGKKKNLPILKMPISYYYNSEFDADVVKLTDIDKELYLQNSSSGIQSVTPLIVLVDYLTTTFYQEKRSPSVNENDEFFKTFIRNLSHIIDSSKRVDELNDSIKSTGKFSLTKPEVDKVVSLLSNRKDYHYSNLIIEEPEQNLFPKTQQDLIYFLFDKILNNKRQHNLLITTHSPFILYAINNCLLGGTVGKKIPKKEKSEIYSNKAWVNPDLVSVWQLVDGSNISIKDNKTKTITKHSFNEIMNEILNEYYDMLNYFEHES